MQHSELLGAYDRPAELVEEARHWDRIGEAEGAAGLRLPFAEALVSDVLVVGRLKRERHGGGGGTGRVQGFGELGFHGRWRDQRRGGPGPGGGGGAEMGREDGEMEAGRARRTRCDAWFLFGVGLSDREHENREDSQTKSKYYSIHPFLFRPCFLVLFDHPSVFVSSLVSCFV
jgi:hypothetical protein